MQRDDLKHLIKKQVTDVSRQPHCPQDDVLASYLEGGLSERNHGQFEKHLADCDFCLERVGMLGRAHGENTPTPVPDLDLARATRMVTPVAETPTRWRTPVRWAAAAVIVLGVGMLTQMQRLDSGTVPAAADPAARTTRSIDPQAMSPGSAADSGELTIRITDGAFDWTLVPDSLYYQVRIVSDEGDLLWQERVEDPHWEIPSRLMLRPGQEYFVRVDAFISESKSLNSDFVLFAADSPE